MKFYNSTIRGLCHENGAVKGGNVSIEQCPVMEFLMVENVALIDIHQ
jgi:hypothetical protein